MLITDCGGGGGSGGGVGTGIGAAFEHFLCPARIFYHIWTLFSLQAQGSEMWPKKMGKICIYIYQNNAAPRPHIDTCIMQYIVLTPLPPTPPTSTDQNHPTPPHTEIDQVPRRFRKIRGKKLCLTRSQLILIPSTWRKPLRTRDRSNNKLQHCWEASALTTAPKKGSWG